VKWPVPLLSMTALIAGHAAFAAATDPADASAAAAPEAPLETVVVKDNLQSTVKAEEARLASIPGGTSLIAADVFEKGRVGTTSDILAFQPGVYAQTAQGSDGLKISIRGSGINRGTGFFRSGTQFYFDGLPLTGAGGTPYELFEPLGLEYTEVLRGGNAFDYGSVALGGAINYVTKSGHDAPGLALRTELGSFDYYKAQAAAGGVAGAFDYYVSLTGSRRNGFQDLSRAETWGIVGNFGYEISPDVETRLYVRHRRTDNQTPGYVRQKDIDADPTRANPQNLQQNASRLQPGSTWIGSKTTFKLDHAQTLTFGVVYHDYPIAINPNPAFGNITLPANGADGRGVFAPNAVLTNSYWWESDLAGLIEYANAGSLFSHRSNSSASLSSTFHPAAGVNVYDNNPDITTGVNAFKTLVKKADYNGSADSVFRLGNDTEVVEDLWVTTGVALVSIKRSSRFDYIEPSITLPTGFQRSATRTTNHVLPRFGVRYDFTPDTTVFANVTRSVEPPNSWSPTTGSGVSTAPDLSNGFLIANLRDQTATGYEVGTRTKAGIFQGSLSLYHSDVRDELLSVQVAPGPPPITRELNGSPTKKQGIEAGLDTILWKGGASDDPFASRSRVLLRQAYTLNAFRYKNDPTYGSNQLPGIPRQFYQGEVSFQHSRGLYGGVSVQYASATFVDYANTFRVRPYTLYGLNFGYDEPSGHWQAYLDVRNLTNKHYTASVSPVFDTRQNPSATANTAAGQPNDLRLLSPGDGFGVFGGFTLKFGK
jgi:iron complex outermembrane receptor protein